jgi:hypothetical protein
MKSSKWILGLMVAVLVLALAPSSFAQVNIQIFNTPSPQEVATARNANTSDPASPGNGILVSGAIIATSPLTGTTLILTFPGVVSSSPDSACLCDAVTGAFLAGNPAGAGGASVTPTGDPMRITGATGLFATATIATVNFSAGTITINLPGSASNTISGTFRLVGARLDVNGKTAPLNATATLGSSSNNYILQTSTVPLINALGAGIASAGIGSNGTNVNTGTALIFTNQTGTTPAKATASLVIGEGFASAWRTTTQTTSSGTDNPAMNGTLIRLTVAGLPAGVSAAMTIAGSGGVATPSAVLSVASVNSSNLAANPPSNVVFVSFTNTDTTKIESLQIDFSLSGTPTGLTPGAITVTATLAPIGAALSGGQPTQSTGSGSTATGTPTAYVRFAQADVGPVTIGSIVAANTTLLIPYAVKVGTYDTGIAIANTTLDPFGTGAGGATASAGTLLFTMFPRNATGADPSFSLTTSSTVRPGVGLSTSGTLVAGGTWTGLMSDIMTAAGKTGDYFGYIFIQTNFLDAHGAAYIFNGAGFTSSTPVLVLPPPASVSRNGNVEALNN